MLSVVELLYVQCVVFEFYDSSFIVVHVAVIWCTENCDDHWEIRAPVPSMHFVAIDLSLMSSDDRDEVILL